MFATDGWTAFMKEVQAAIDMLTLDAANTTEDLWLLKGKLEALRSIAAYESGVYAVENQYELQQHESAE
jgi:hypothetical protein